MQIKPQWDTLHTIQDGYNQTENNKCWWGETGILLHYHWELKMVQLPWKAVWQFLKKLNSCCMYDLAILILGIYSAKSLQSCPTLCDPRDGSPPGSPTSGILQARTLEWVAISFSSAWKWKVKVKSLSPVGLLATPWTAAYQAPPSMGFSRQEYWSGVPLPSPRYILKRIKTYVHKKLQHECS